MKLVRKGEKGFTLIELLIVVAILGVLAAVVIPNVGRFLGWGEDEARRTEYHNMASAIIAMMVDNNLATIPTPLNYAGGTAYNLLGDDPAVAGVEGFPDITATMAAKATKLGITYTGLTGRLGYVLYRHDKPKNATEFDTVSYVSMLKTRWYYTCEADGTLRQFNGATVATATEYSY